MEPGKTSPEALIASLDDANARLFVRLLGRPDGRDMLYRISGTVHNHVPGDVHGKVFPHGRVLFGVEGYNIRRLVHPPGTDDLHMVSREIVFYTDPKDGSVLTEWTNPLDGQTRPLPPIANDRVQLSYRIRAGALFALFGPAEVPLAGSVAPRRVHRNLVWTLDVPPVYRLADRYGIDDDFGLANSTYTSWELFDFLVHEDDAREYSGTHADTRTGAMPVTNCWSRICPYVPAMGIAESETPGNLVYHARAWTLDGFDALEPWLADLVRTRHPLYTSAPDTPGTGPNTTTWTAFHAGELAPRGLTWREWRDSTP
ncbi:DUF1838 domain-containing protein (plasmid) [Embleya sp. NBC_00888]|uniref:DUF1838 family protein n=1 Tax=Embleya sp. NBC_00888 TaxID=2975960 RepID=UPI002F9165B4|nr:DUF1838 domain-containing protein [Embleya sp. NBC_00888]